MADRTLPGTLSTDDPAAHPRRHARRIARRQSRPLVATLALLIAGIALSCGDTVSPPERRPAPAATLDIVSDLPAICGTTTSVDLIADETVPVGTIQISSDDEHLYVVYRTSSDWPIGKTALFVGDDAGEIPTNAAGNPVIGQFPFQESHPAGTTEVIWEVSLDRLSGLTAVVAAFAEVGETAEGAWADGEPINARGSWATYTTHAVTPCGPTAIVTDPGDPATVQAGTPLAFDGSASEDPAGGGLVYGWDFGDGALGGAAEMAHIYAEAGTFTATLTVTDVWGFSDEAQVEVGVTPPPSPVASDGILRGRVVDQADEPLPGVAVALPGDGVLGTTDANGEVLIENFPTGVDRVLRLSLSGYTDDIVRVRVPADVGEGFFEGGLRPRNDPQILPAAEQGGTVTGEDGAALVLPAGALVDGAGNPVEGAVEVSITPLDVSGPERAAFPGEFLGVGPDGVTRMIVSLGATEYLLTQGGEELQLGPGATATLRLPIYTTGAGATVPLWSLDEATGLWIREGEGTVVDGALEAEVAHLSTWNADFEQDATIVFMDCFFLDPTDCSVSAATQDDGPAWSGTGTLSADGEDVPLPAGRRVELEGFAFEEECVARDAVVVDVPETGEPDPIEFDLECPDAVEPATRLAYGELLQDAIAEAGEVKRYVWSGEPGDEVRVDLDPEGAFDGVYRIADPDGVLLDDGFVQGDDLFFTLEKSGDYGISVEGETSEETGAYWVRVDRFVLEEPQPLELPALVEGTIGFPELETDAYQFQGSSGEEVSFAIRTENRIEDRFFRFEGEIRVLSPAGALLAQDPFGTTAREIGARGLRLPEDGTYTVEVRSRDALGQPDDPGAYVLAMEPNAGTPLANGDVAPGSISDALDVDVYTFALATAENVRITLSSVPEGEDLRDRIRIRIHDPDGVERVNSGGSFDGVDHFFVDTPAEGGEFRITVHGASRLGPDYEIAMDVFEEEPVRTLVDGDVVTGQIGFPPEVDTYEFEGQEGEEMTLTVRAAQSEPFAGTVEILDPNGTSLASGDFTHDAAFADGRTLAETGTYTVEVAGTDGIPFDYEIALELNASADANVLTTGDVIESSIDVVGGDESFTFEGTNGQAVRIHAIPATSSDLTGRVHLTPPSGTEEVVIDRFGPGGSGNVVVDLTEDGTHTLRVEQAWTTGTGAYKLGLGTGLGRRDLAFGPFGIGEVRGGSGSGRFEQVAVLSGGLILARTGTELFRFDASGATDASFGDNGVVDLQTLLGVGFVTAMRVLPDESILLAAPLRNTEFNGWRVGKLDADGALDLAFGTDGIADVPITETVDVLRDFPVSLIPVPDGTGDDILVAGTSRAPDLGPRVVTLARLDPDGALDGSFGGGSNPLVTDLSLNVRGAVQQADGRIVVGGSFGAGTAIAYRFDPDGTQDATFGATGEARVVYDGGGLIRGMALRTDDRLVLFGDGDQQMAAVQLTASGDADASFGTGGIVLIDYSHDEIAVAGLVDPATDDLYLAGNLRILDSGEPEGMLVRLRSDGSLDPPFAVGGQLLEESPDQMHSLALDASGGLLVGATTITSSQTATLMRLLP